MLFPFRDRATVDGISCVYFGPSSHMPPICSLRRPASGAPSIATPSHSPAPAVMIPQQRSITPAHQHTSTPAQPFLNSTGRWYLAERRAATALQGSSGPTALYDGKLRWAACNGAETLRAGIPAASRQTKGHLHWMFGQATPLHRRVPPAWRRDSPSTNAICPTAIWSSQLRSPHRHVRLRGRRR